MSFQYDSCVLREPLEQIIFSGHVILIDKPRCGIFIPRSPDCDSSISYSVLVYSNIDTWQVNFYFKIYNSSTCHGMSNMSCGLSLVSERPK